MIYSLEFNYVKRAECHPKRKINISVLKFQNAVPLHIYCHVCSILLLLLDSQRPQLIFDFLRVVKLNYLLSRVEAT
jgi:hypothetical protein